MRFLSSFTSGLHNLPVLCKVQGWLAVWTVHILKGLSCQLAIICSQWVPDTRDISLLFILILHIYTNYPGGFFDCERAMRKFLGCVFLTICCHYAQSSRILLGTEYSNEPRHGEYSAAGPPPPPHWRTKENFWKFYKPEQRRTSRNLLSGQNPPRNNINTHTAIAAYRKLFFIQFHLWYFIDLMV